MAQNTTPVPEGLDEFISAPNMQASNQGAVPAVSSEPHGLDEFLGPELKQLKYGSPVEQAKAAVEGLGQGVAGPLAPYAEEQLGVDPEDIRARAEANPVTHYGSEIAGLVAPAIATAGGSAATRLGLEGIGAALPALGKLTQTGLMEAAVKKIVPEAGSTLASQIGTGAAKAAIDNMMLAGSDETSRMILKDPDQSAQTAIASVGLSGLFGGALGGALGAVSHTWQSAFGNRASKVIADFKARINEHMTNPDPVSQVTGELSDHYNNIKAVADDVYGPQGLKAQDIAKSMPPMSSEIHDQTSNIADMLDTKLDKLQDKGDALSPLLADEIAKYKSAVQSEDPSAIFNANQDLKQQLQEWGKYNKSMVPLKERGFRDAARDLAGDLRESLEDSDVWGKAADRQKAINKAFVDFKPALEDFERKFTTEVGGVKQIDPGKINTYMNQLGKPNAEIKQQMLGNFLNASEKYQNVISDTHANLGLDSPFPATPLNATQATLGEKTTGSKLADIFIKKGLTDAGGKALGAGTGAVLSHAVGLHAGIGALIGEHALGPFFSSVLPAIAKPLTDSATSGEAFKAASDYGVAVAKGQSLINKATKNVFKIGSDVLAENMIPSEKERNKLDKILQKYQANPAAMLETDRSTAHYLPDHTNSMNQTAATAVNYLNSLRADLDKKSPLDSKPVPSSTQTAKFNNALNIAQQPLLVLDKIKKGTLTTQDIMTMTSIYPSLYKGLQGKVQEQLTEVINKGETIPYRLRSGLSMFLGQPLDSTMTPQAIQMAQMSSPGASQSQAPQQRPSKGSPSSPALQKMPAMYSTPGQAGEARRSKVQ